MKRVLRLLAVSVLFTACAYSQTPDAAKERETVVQIYERVRARKRTAGKMQPYKVTIPNTLISYGMAPIPAGDFMMGSSHKKDEQPVHKVHVDAFWIQVHEVTWDEY